MVTAARCGRCGREVPVGASFCPGCGNDLRDNRPRLATGLLPANQRLNNRYIVAKKLAQGGQSAVYLVMDMLEGGAERAVKEMSEAHLGSTEEREKAINDFNREAKMLGELHHPALATVYDTFVEGQKHFLVMEYVGGQNLEDVLITANRPLEWERVVGWGIALCDVLSYVHAQNPPIIYRDLKPANVMLTPAGTIKLVDFGIARWLHPQRRRDTAQLGTDGYAPLEQYSARSEPRSDLYALGASLYHLLTGRVPEAAPTRIAGEMLTPIRAINPLVPEAVERVVLRALNLQAKDRFEDATQMRAALEWSRQPEGTPAARSYPTAGPAPRSGRLGAGGSAAGAAMGRSQATGIPPRLHVYPLRLDAGFLEPSQSATLRLEVTNRGGGQLAGHTETNMPCIQVDPNHVAPGVSALQVRIDTTGLRPGPYICHLALRTSGGDQIIPVRFIVRSQIGSSDLVRRQTQY